MRPRSSPPMAPTLSSPTLDRAALTARIWGSEKLLLGAYESVGMHLRWPGLPSMWPVGLLELWYPALSSMVMILPTSVLFSPHAPPPRASCACRPHAPPERRLPAGRGPPPSGPRLHGFSPNFRAPPPVLASFWVFWACRRGIIPQGPHFASFFPKKRFSGRISRHTVHF